MPVVVDAILIAHQEKRPEVRYWSAQHLSRAANRSQHHAVTMIASGRERPLPRKLVAAGHLLGLAGRVVRRGVHQGGVLTPHLVLRSFIEESELPRMYPDDAGDPCSGRRNAREFD